MTLTNTPTGPRPGTTTRTLPTNTTPRPAGTSPCTRREATRSRTPPPGTNLYGDTLSTGTLSLPAGTGIPARTTLPAGTATRTPARAARTHPPRGPTMTGRASTQASTCRPSTTSSRSAALGTTRIPTPHPRGTQPATHHPAATTNPGSLETSSASTVVPLLPAHPSTHSTPTTETSTRPHPGSTRTARPPTRTPTRSTRRREDCGALVGIAGTTRKRCRELE